MGVTADALDAALPQTQCTRCGFPDCRRYAEAIAGGEAAINRCPPGGAEGIVRLAQLTGRPLLPLDPHRGHEGPRLLAVIDEAWCIGCTLCLQACPVDSIVGGPKSMHTVMDWLCTGCELCVPVCPVDCIALVPVSGTLTGWNAWSEAQAAQARARHAVHRARLEREEQEEAGRLAALSPSGPIPPGAAPAPAPAAAAAAAAVSPTGSTGAAGPAAPPGGSADSAAGASASAAAHRQEGLVPADRTHDGAQERDGGASHDEQRAQAIAAALARSRAARNGRRGP